MQYLLVLRQIQTNFENEAAIKAVKISVSSVWETNKLFYKYFPYVQLKTILWTLIVEAVFFPFTSCIKVSVRKEQDKHISTST